MSEKQSRTLRKIIFGDFSYRNKEYTTDTKGTVRCIGKHAVYKVAKKNIKRVKEVINRIKQKRKSGPRWLNPTGGNKNGN